MTAWSASGRGSLLAAVAARAERWFLEPAEPQAKPAEPDAGMRPVVAVVGLAPRCGATMVARALAVELAKRDPAGSAVVSTHSRVPGGALATTAARRLARSLPAEAAAAIGRLCAVDAGDPALRRLCAARPAPVVLDVPHGSPPETALALADAVVLVAGPDTEAALADVVAASLTRGERVPVVVLNRAVDPGDWEARGAVVIGDIRLGARLALAGRDPTPALAGAIAELADRIVPGDST